ncbi:Uncharacterized conserved protein YloU, alkaline shock protein (Asp23) family [Acetitomaculum ruminis DSM 5522]|uniref:Uncharacterized conserved protein YloU, alkaline shock protein (Asp23) family n=1 Tax=Acetitomaculum ruminis DSM 5522 TaxID=1120918 RepID=A0A1I0VU58_9FIRM|nr:Asp23/Gls24 family envelope stress response protein [Acetitomaculum ruminis]SFA79567.1 Uncharacterized conserved protein YloU, alkaline shock protein (Asp23) family [Acetitomaculum ruminis DSM 5522]
MPKDDKNVYIIKDDDYGEVQIAQQVVAVIAGFAATEVEGVNALAGNITNDIVGRVSKKNLARGVRIQLENGIVRTDIAIYIDFGQNIPKVCETVQDRVKTAIENMTGLQTANVNIRIVGIGSAK